jgi:AsmA protein
VAVIVVGVAALVIAASTLSPDRLRGELQQAVRRATGRDLTIAGGVHLRLGVAPEMVLDRIALANPDGASRPQMVTASSLRAKLALLPLLFGDAVISSIVIEQPDILLERTADGRPNWQFTPERRGAQASPRAAGGGGGTRHEVEIRTIRLVGGQIAWHPAQGADIVLGIGQMTLSAEAPDTPMNCSFEGTRGGVPIKLTASAGSLGRLQGGPVGALAGAWPLSIDVATQGATLHLEGGINHPEQWRSYQFRVTARAPALDQLNALLPSPVLPPVADVNATALLSDGSQGEMRTSQLSIRAGASDLSRYVPGLMVKQAVLSAPGPGQLMQLSVDGVYQSQPLRLAAAAMQADIVGAAGPMQITANASAGSANLSAHGTIPPELNTTGLDLAIDFRAPDLSALSPLVGHGLPPARDLTLTAELVDAGVKLRGMAIRNLAMNSSLGDLAGAVTIDWAPRAAIEGNLTSHTLDLDALLPGGAAGLALPAVWPPPSAADTTPLVATAPPAAAADAPTLGAEAAPRPAFQLPMQLLRSADANLTVSADDLTIGGAHYRDLTAQLQLAGGKLALNPFRALAPEGAIVGGASIDASTDQPPVAVSLRSPSIAASAVAAALGYPGGVSGTMQVDADLSGVGQTLAAIEASLSGHIGLAMVNGQVDNSLIESLIGSALDTSGVGSFAGGTSQVRCFGVRIDFSEGVGRIQALSADMTKLTLDGGGEIDLRTRSADLHLRPRVRLGPTEIAAPLTLRGPFGALKPSLDPVMGGGRVGLSIGGAPAGPSACAAKLSLVRNGLGGPLPAAAPTDSVITIRKPKDLLKGLFH